MAEKGGDDENPDQPNEDDTTKHLPDLLHLGYLLEPDDNDRILQYVNSSLGNAQSAEQRLGNLDNLELDDLNKFLYLMHGVILPQKHTASDRHSYIINLSDRSEPFNVLLGAHGVPNRGLINKVAKNQESLSQKEHSIYIYYRNSEFKPTDEHTSWTSCLDTLRDILRYDSLKRVIVRVDEIRSQITSILEISLSRELFEKIKFIDAAKDFQVDASFFRINEGIEEEC